MATVATSAAPRKVQHYASYVIDGQDISGIATLAPGGYAFRPEGTHAVRLVSYKDVDLMLYGRCDLADAQAEADGDKVYRTSRTLQERAA